LTKYFETFKLLFDRLQNLFRRSKVETFFFLNFYAFIKNLMALGKVTEL